MSACESTRGEWGGRCPDCGEMLPPAPRPWSGWRSERIDPVTSANARLSSTGNLFSKIKRAQALARRTAA